MNTESSHAAAEPAPVAPTTAKPRRGRALLLISANALAVACLGAVLLLQCKPTPAMASVAPQETAVPATVLQVQPVATDVWRTYSGRFEAVEEVQVRARVSGAVQSIAFAEGQLVEQGEPLLRIDPAPYQAEVERMRAQLVAAEARRTYTAQESERAERLWQTRVIAERDRDRAMNEAREAQAQVAMARAALRAAQLELDYTSVRAPISGRVGRREITVGNLVDAGPSAPVLTTLLSVDPIHASFEADDEAVRQALADIGGDRGRLDEVPIQAFVDGREEPLAGQLQLIDNRVDNRSGTVRLRARFSNPDGLLTPGQFTRLQLGRARREAVMVVPEQAIGTDQDRRYVLVLDPQDRATYREVTLGAAVRGDRVVSAGLQPGDRVVASNLQRVRPGTLVARQAEPSSSSALATNE